MLGAGLPAAERNDAKCASATAIPNRDRDNRERDSDPDRARDNRERDRVLSGAPFRGRTR
jgi:hypothetical protein